jgi:transcriptional regulator with XRE-family HTH domain
MGVVRVAEVSDEARSAGLRAVLRALVEERAARRLSRTAVAARMGTSEAAVARLETGRVDPRLSTLERFAEAVGTRLEWRLVDTDLEGGG